MKALKDFSESVGMNTLGFSAEEKGKIESEIGRYLSYLRNIRIRESLAYAIAAGGKRIRPCLLVLAYKAAGGKKVDSIMPFAAAVEFIHNWALVHDDIIDESEMRRGVPTVHVRWGADAALLAGDALNNLPYFMLKDADFDQKLCIEMIGSIAQASLDIVDGQMMDVYFEKRADVTEDEYFEMEKKKTGSLIRCAAEMGATLATRDEEKIKAFEKYGEVLGVAFGIRDGILDLIGDKEKLGKDTGRDIRQGKKTLVVIHALANAPSKNAEHLLEILGNRDCSMEAVQEAVAILKKTGSIDYAQEVVRVLSAKAKSALGILSNTEYKTALLNLADFVVSREL